MWFFKKKADTISEIKDLFNKTIEDALLSNYGVELVIKGILEKHLPDSHLQRNPVKK
jgi:hypothetical protein